MWNLSPTRQKGKETKTDQNKIGIQSRRWSLVLPCPLSPRECHCCHYIHFPCLTISSKIQSSCLHAHAFVSTKRHNPKQAKVMNKCKHTALEHSTRICACSTHRQLQQCLTTEVIDFNAWYTGVRNAVKLTVGWRLWRRSQWRIKLCEGQAAVVFWECVFVAVCRHMHKCKT